MATLAGRPTSHYRLRAPVVAGPPRWKRAEQWLERPALAQFVYLSLLLHAMAILLFGAPAGGSREGRALWGSLNVTLLGPAREAPAPVALEPPRIAPPAPKIERRLAPPPARKAQPHPAPPPVPATQAPAPTAPIEVPIVVPPVIERIAAPPLKLDKAVDVPRMEVIPVPQAPPVAIPAPMQPIVPDLPRVERTLAEPPKIAVPVAQPLPPPPVKVAPQTEPQRVETPALPAVPPKVEKPAVEAPALPAIPPKAEKPALETPVLPSTPQPAAIERAPELPPQAAPKPAPAPPPPAQEVAPKQEAPRIERAPIPREELAPRVIPRPSVPAPAPVEKRGDDYDPTKPAVDVDALRSRASQIAREGTGQRALLPFPMPAVPPRKSKTEEALEKARKPDCRTAYKDMGLLAVVPLVANEFGEGNCRW